MQLSPKLSLAVTGVFVLMLFSGVAWSSTQKTSHFIIPASLTLQHIVVGPTNTYAGSMTIPMPCDLLVGGFTTDEETPTHVVLNLKHVSGSSGCTTPTSTRTFSASFAAPDQKLPPVLDAVTVDGKNVPFTLIEAQH